MSGVQDSSSASTRETRIKRKTSGLSKAELWEQKVEQAKLKSVVSVA